MKYFLLILCLLLCAGTGWAEDGVYVNGVEQGGTGSGTVGPGTENTIAKFATSTTVGDSVIFDDGTNVGIGTTVPSSKLDVVGDVEVSASLTTSDLYVNALHLTGDGTGIYMDTDLEIDGSITGTDLYVTTLNFTGAGSALNMPSANLTGDLTVTNQIFIGDTDCRFRQNTNSLEFTNDAGSTWTAVGSGGMDNAEDTAEGVAVTGDLTTTGGLTATGGNIAGLAVTATGTLDSIEFIGVGTYGQTFVDNNLIMSLTESGTVANVIIDDDMKVNTDLTVDRNVCLSNAASGTGVLYAVVMDSTGKLYKTSTIWNK